MHFQVHVDDARPIVRYFLLSCPEQIAKESQGEACALGGAPKLGSDQLFDEEEMPLADPKARQTASQTPFRPLA